MKNYIRQLASVFASPCVGSPGSYVVALPTRSYPSRAKAMATARPMPRPAPVTNAQGLSDTAVLLFEPGCSGSMIPSPVGWRYRLFVAAPWVMAFPDYASVTRSCMKCSAYTLIMFIYIVFIYI